jgi:anti-sigma factor RsiW
MIDNRRYEQLREVSWRRQLSAAEEAEVRTWLTAHPHAQPDWETEHALSDALRRLPEAPVSSNFTSRVLQTVERDMVTASRDRQPFWRRWHWRLRWLPRFTVAAVVVVAGLFSYRHVSDVRRTEHWLQPLELVSGVAVPNTEILESFEATSGLKSHLGRGCRTR